MNVFKKIAAILKKDVEETTPTEEVEEAETIIEEERREETSVPAAQIFKNICNAAGIGDKRLNSVSAIEKFEEWYTGPSDEESVRESIAAFRDEYPSINAKLEGKL